MGLWVRDDRTGFALGASDESRDFVFEVAAAEPLEVTLAWTDFPSTPAASPHLNNDLDLVVAGPAGTFLGNVFAAGESVGTILNSARIKAGTLDAWLLDPPGLPSAGGRGNPEKADLDGDRSTGHFPVRGPRRIQASIRRPPL